jgi:hypothetical protein
LDVPTDAVDNDDSALTTLCAVTCIGCTDNVLPAESATRLSAVAELSAKDDNGLDASVEPDLEPPGAVCGCCCAVLGNGVGAVNVGAVNVGVLCAPPVLCATPDLGSLLALELSDAVPVATVDPACGVLLGGVAADEAGADPEFELGDCVGWTGAGDGTAVADGPVDGDVVEPVDEPVVEPVDEPVEDVFEFVSDGSAETTPGVVAIATPTPNATAKAPTRPMYRA